MIARRAARAVAACDLEPRGLPESAILIVRRMPDPAPRRLLTDRSHWERKARAKLEQFAAEATRAAWDAAADSAPAVWFEDRTEMSACFTADIAAGQAQRRWWWRIPLRQLDRQHPYRARFELFCCASRMRYRKSCGCWRSTTGSKQ